MNISRTSTVALSLLALTLALASCGGGPAPITAPGDVTTFTATASASTAVNLGWSAASGAAAYTLERKTNTGTYAEIARNLDANTTSYTDTGLTPSTPYTYRLKASNSAGSSAGIERSVVTPAPGDRSFDLSVTPGALTLNVGQSGTVAVTLQRPANPEGSVALSLEGAVVGDGVTKISGTFGGTAGTTLTLKVGAEVPVGAHTLTVRGKNGSVEKTAAVTVNVERWAVVDDDDSFNNIYDTDPAYAPDSAADLRVRAAMTAAGKTYDVFVVPDGTGGEEAVIPDGPSAAQLAKYSGVVYYSGNSFATAMTNDDLAAMSAFVDGADRKLIVLSSAVLRNAVGGRNQMQQPVEGFRPFLVARAGLTGAASGETIMKPAYTLVGQSGTVTQDLNVAVGARSFRSYMTPAAGTVALFKEGENVIATGRAATGSSGSSKVLVAGFEINDVSQADASALLGRFLNF